MTVSSRVDNNSLRHLSMRSAVKFAGIWDSLNYKNNNYYGMCTVATLSIAAVGVDVTESLRFVDALAGVRC